MVYLHFPESLTEEEVMLQAKYEKLKRKKKALQNLRAPKPEPEKVTPIKRPSLTEGGNAREIAKKLLKSGAIAAIKKIPRREDRGEGFKRPRGYEKMLEKNSNISSGFQPFHSSSVDNTLSYNEDDAYIPKAKKLYDNIYETSTVTKPSASTTSRNTSQPKPGNTVMVQGADINEDMLQNSFSTFGEIIKIVVEAGKNNFSRGFVTFAELSSATRAVEEFNGAVVSNCHLKVDYARFQPVVEERKSDPSPATNLSSSTVWASGQQQSHTESRKVVTYDDLFSSGV